MKLIFPLVSTVLFLFVEREVVVRRLSCVYLTSRLSQLSEIMHLSYRAPASSRFSHDNNEP
jgi:hypothetical protein